MYNGIYLLSVLLLQIDQILVHQKIELLEGKISEVIKHFYQIYITLNLYPFVFLLDTLNYKSNANEQMIFFSSHYWLWD